VFQVHTIQKQKRSAKWRTDGYKTDIVTLYFVEFVTNLLLGKQFFWLLTNMNKCQV